MKERPHGIAYDDWWPEPYPMSGSAHAVSGDAPDEQPALLVPDRDAPDGWREHRPTPKRRMGF